MPRNKNIGEKREIREIPPFYLLKKFLSAAKIGNALDIGAGNGQNSFFLAEKGYKVEAVDINKEKIKNIKQIAARSKLKIIAKKIDARKFDFSKKRYDIILAVQSLIFIKKSEFQKILSKIKKTLEPEGTAIISLFTVQDASYKRFKKTLPQIEENTFKTRKTKQYWQFLKKGELKKYFEKENFDILFYEEEIIRDKPHEGTPYPHKHGIAKMVVKKKAR